MSEWADRYRVLDQNQPEPGPWSTDRAPYLRGIMDAFSDPLVERITFVACTQVGKTEALINCLGYAIDQNPGPALWVLPKSDLLGTFVGHRLMPAIEASKTLVDQVLDGRSDWTKRGIVFQRMHLLFGSSNSPTDLSSNPMRYLFLDEVDKYPLFSGREADPISLAEERTSNFPDSKIFKVSTPTTEAGYIWRSWELSDQRTFHVPCPFCGTFQVLTFGNVKWPDDVHGQPERIEQGELAWYECAKCKERIEERHKRGMLARGVWVPAGGRVSNDGRAVGGMSSPHAGFHVSALYSPWRTWSDCAAKFLRSKDDHAALMNFNNSWLGVIWQEKAAETTEDHVRALVEPYAANVVPADAKLLTAGIDIGEHEIHFVVRAWGAGTRSWLVQCDRLHTLEQVDSLVTTGMWKRADGGQMPIALACIDSGFRTDEVYEMCRGTGDLIRPTKGYDKLRDGGFFRVSRIERTVDGKPFGVQLWQLNTTLLKDKLHRLITTPAGQPGRFAVHAEAPPDYLRTLIAEHKVVVRSKTTGLATEVWRKRPGGGANHYFDAEVYALAAAEMLQVHATAGGEQLATQPTQARGERDVAPMAQSAARRGGFIGARDNWIGGARKGWLRQ